MIDQNLLAAYRMAKYVINFNGQQHRIQVGQVPDSVDSILRFHNAKSAYFITPENPFSCRLSEQENALRHQRFIDELNARHYIYLTGYSTDESETWPSEMSYLIFSDDETRMQSLAIRFGQNAFLQISVNSPVQLYVLEKQNYVAR